MVVNNGNPCELAEIEAEVAGPTSNGDDVQENHS
jgi:hypothetical protein